MLVQTKNTMAAAHMRLDQKLTMRDIYINFNLNSLTKFTSSSRRTTRKAIFPWNISQMITKTVTISTRIVTSYTISFRRKANWNWGNNMIRISRWMRSLCRTNTCVRRWEWQSGIRVGKLTIWVRSFEIEKLKPVHQVIQFDKSR